MTVSTVQLLTMRLSGFKAEAVLDVEGIAHYRVTAKPAEATLRNVPFGEVSNLAGDFLMGWPQAAELGGVTVLTEHRPWDSPQPGAVKVYAVLPRLGVAIPARVTSRQPASIAQFVHGDFAAVIDA